MFWYQWKRHFKHTTLARYTLGVNVLNYVVVNSKFNFVSSSLLCKYIDYVISKRRVSFSVEGCSMCWCLLSYFQLIIHCLHFYKINQNKITNKYESLIWQIAVPCFAKLSDYWSRGHSSASKLNKDKNNLHDVVVFWNFDLSNTSWVKVDLFCGNEQIQLGHLYSTVHGYIIYRIRSAFLLTLTTQMYQPSDYSNSQRY